MGERKTLRVAPGMAGSLAPRLFSSEDPAWRATTGMRLRTLLILRWLAVIGQTAAIAIVHFGFGFALPLLPCLGIIAASAVLNVTLASRYPSSKLLTEREAALYLAFDVLQLTLLLMFTGGIANPFAILLLAPVTIAATMLTGRVMFLVMFFALACGTLIWGWHWPLPWRAGETVPVDPLYGFGQWAALALSLGFMTIYAARISVEARRLSEALTRTRLSLASEQKLSALGSLAAAAAHELGTPLGTIAVVAKEMQREGPKEGQLAEDIALLVSEANRCRQILGRLSRDPASGDDAFKIVRLGTFLEELADQYRSPRAEIVIDAAAEPAVDRDVDREAGSMGSLIGRGTKRAPWPGVAEPLVRRTPELRHGMANLVENATDFATTTVVLRARWSAETVTIAVEDDGPGFSPEVIERLGEPYVTTRRRREQAELQRDEHEGMGLGFFIAKTLIERTGGRLRLQNRMPPATGATVSVSWSRAAIEVGEAEGESWKVQA